MYFGHKHVETKPNFLHVKRIFKVIRHEKFRPAEFLPQDSVHARQRN